MHDKFTGKREGGCVLQPTLLTPGLLHRQTGLAIAWTGFLYLPALVSPEQAPLLYLLLILAASGMAGLLIFLFCRFYYRDIHLQTTQPLAMSLLVTAFLTALIVYQAIQWPGLSILMVSLLAIIHFRSVIRGMSDLLFVFWAVLSGLLIGLGLVGPVLLLNGLLCLFGYLVVHRRLSRTSYHFIIRCEQAALAELECLLQGLRTQEISRREESGRIDLVLEVSLRDVSLTMVDRVAALNGVQRAVIVAVGRNSETAG